MGDNLTQGFLAVLGFIGVIRLWLAQRQVAHVRMHRGAVPGQFADRIALSAHQKAADYAVARSRFGMACIIVELGLLLILTVGGGLLALHDFWSQRSGGVSYGMALLLSVLALSGAASLSLRLYRQLVIEARFGFNRMTLALFLADAGKQALLQLVVVVPSILCILWLMPQTGSRWWLGVWAFWLALDLLELFVYPVFIAPLFNSFTPLADAALKARIEALLARCGFASSGLFIMDGSRRSAHGNAYFTGIGNAKRIVFFDTLLGRLQAEEIAAVVAHELGHFRQRHLLKRFILVFGLRLVFLALCGVFMAAPGFFSALGLGAPAAQGAAVGLTLVVLLLPLFTFIATPLVSLICRRYEFEADSYAARHASADALARALVRLYQDNASTLTPDPWHSLFYDTHPTAVQRLARLQVRPSINLD